MKAKTLVSMIAAIGLSLSFSSTGFAQSSTGSVDAQAYEWLKAPVASQPDPIPLATALRQLSPPTLRVVYEDPSLAQALVAWPQSPSRAGALNQATRNAGLVVSINSDGTLSVRKGPGYRAPVAAPVAQAAPSTPVAGVGAFGGAPSMAALPPAVSAMFGAGVNGPGASVPAPPPVPKADSAVAQTLPQVTPSATPNRIDPSDIAKARAYVASGGVSQEAAPVKDKTEESIAPNAPLNEGAVRYLAGFIDNPNRIVQLSVREGTSYRGAFVALLAPKTIQWRAGSIEASKRFQITGPAKQVLPRLLRQVKRDTGVDLSLEVGRKNVVIVAVNDEVKVAKEAPPVRQAAPRPSPKTDLPPPGAGQSDNDMAMAAVMSTKPTLLLNKGQSIGNAWLTAGIRQNVKVYWDAPDYIVTDNVRLEAATVEDLGRQLVNSLNRNGANLKLVVYENPQGGVSSYRIVTAN